MVLNIEKFLISEIKSKKQSVEGRRYRVGSKGSIKMRLPSDYLKGKAKQQYTGITGKVTIYNMYDEMVSLQKFTQMNEEDQKRHLEGYRDRKSNKEIQDTWEISHNHLNKMVKDLGVKPKPRGGSEKGKRTYKKRAGKQQPVVETKQEQAPTPTPAVTQELVYEILDKKEKTNGMSLSFNGEYSAEEIIRKLDKFGLILSEEPSQFKIELKITELES